MVGPTVLWAMAAVPLWLASDSFTGWMRASIIVQSSLTVTALVGWLVILAIRWRQERGGNPGSVTRQQFLWIAGSAAVAGLLTLSLWLVPALLTGQAATFEPDRFVEFEIPDGWITGRASYRIDPLPAGATLLTSRMQFHVHGLGRVLEPLLGPALARDSRRDEAVLKRVLEGST